MGQNRGSGAILTPNELVLPLPILVKIDQEMRPCKCSQTERYTDRQTDAKRFFNLSHMLYATAMGQIITQLFRRHRVRFAICMLCYFFWLPKTLIMTYICDSPVLMVHVIQEL